MSSFIYKYFLVAYKVVFAFFGFWAVNNEIATLVQRGSFKPTYFFSFFTIESNIFAAVMLLMGAAALIAKTKSPIIDSLRGAATLYMALTGVVFAILLSGLDPSVLTAMPIDNTILHYIMPVALVVDWILHEPTATLHKRSVLTWLIFPVVYLIYTLIRGPIVHWYPYPFVNPNNGGYGKVIITCLVIAVGVALFGFLVRARSRITLAGGRLKLR